MVPLEFPSLGRWLPLILAVPALLGTGCQQGSPYLGVEQDVPLFLQPSRKAHPAATLPLGEQVEALRFEADRTEWWRVEIPGTDVAAYARLPDLIPYPVVGEPAFVARPRACLFLRRDTRRREGACLRYGEPLRVRRGPPATEEHVAIVDDGFIRGYLEARDVSGAKPPAPRPRAGYIVVPRAERYSEQDLSSASGTFYELGTQVTLVIDPPFGNANFVAVMSGNELLGFLVAGEVRTTPPNADLVMELARKHLIERDLAGCLSMARHALRLDPDHAAAAELAGALENPPPLSGFNRFVVPATSRVAPGEQAYVTAQATPVFAGTPDRRPLASLSVNTRVLVQEVSDAWATVQVLPPLRSGRSIDLGPYKNLNRRPLATGRDCPSTFEEDVRPGDPVEGRQERPLVESLSGRVARSALAPGWRDPAWHLQRSRLLMERASRRAVLPHLVRLLEITPGYREALERLHVVALMTGELALSVYAATRLDGKTPATVRPSEPDDIRRLEVVGIDLAFGCRGEHRFAGFRKIEDAYLDEHPSPSGTCAEVHGIMPPCPVCESDYYTWGDGDDVLTDPEGLEEASRYGRLALREHQEIIADLRKYFPGPSRLRVVVRNPTARPVLPADGLWLIGLPVVEAGFPYDMLVPIWQGAHVAVLPVPSVGPYERLELWVEIDPRDHDGTLWAVLAPGDPDRVARRFEAWVDTLYPCDPHAVDVSENVALRPLAHTLREPPICGPCH